MIREYGDTGIKNVIVIYKPSWFLATKDYCSRVNTYPTSISRTLSTVRNDKIREKPNGKGAELTY